MVLMLGSLIAEIGVPTAAHDGKAGTKLESKPMILWSKKLGSFERHLQRRHQNPLFPVQRQKVTAAELAIARDRDARDAREVKQEFLDLLKFIDRLPSQITSSEFKDLRKRIDDLTRKAIGVGGEVTEIAPELEELRAVVIESWEKGLEASPTDIEALQKAEQLYHRGASLFHNPLVVQMTRRDSPIPPEETVPTILSEDITSISVAMEILPTPERIRLQQTALQLVREVRARGEALPDIEVKLRAMGALP